MKKDSFTLMELLIVIIIVGILAVLSLTQYGSYRESALDKEAKANLKLIMAAERIYKMEIGFYYSSGSSQPTAINNINTNLRLLLSAATNRNWNYLATSVVSPAAACTQATRTGSDFRNWRLRHTEDDPVKSAVCP